MIFNGGGAERAVGPSRKCTERYKKLRELTTDGRVE
jgi:hypothetical protein